MVLAGLFVTPAVTAIGEALASARADGRIAVIGHAKLAAALAGPTREIVPVALSARAARRMPNNVAALSDVTRGSLDAVVGIDVTVDAGWEATLRAWADTVRDGGALVLVDRGHAPEATRRALCAGLSEIEQRVAGRLVVTSGIVSQL